MLTHGYVTGLFPASVHMNSVCTVWRVCWVIPVSHDWKLSRGGFKFFFSKFPVMWSLQMLRHRCPSSKYPKFTQMLKRSLKQWCLASQPPWLYLHKRPLLKIEIIMFTSPVTRTNVNITAVCRNVCWQKNVPGMWASDAVGKPQI